MTITVAMNVVLLPRNAEAYHKSVVLLPRNIKAYHKSGKADCMRNKRAICICTHT